MRRIHLKQTSFANRGRAIEERIEEANAVYRVRSVALIQKIPTPVGIIRLLPGGKLTGFWQKPSTVDFIGFGATTGVAVETKKTNRKAFPLDQIHAHQRRFLTEVEAYGHLALLLVDFSGANRTFTVPWNRVQKEIEAGTAGLPLAWFLNQSDWGPSAGGYAEQFLAAGRAVRALPKEARSSPVAYYLFLFCRALELILKAFLLTKAFRVNDLTKGPYGHNLMRLLKTALDNAVVNPLPC